jgi:hypothetical protein
MTFRILKVDPREARELARKFAANPGWLFAVPPEDRVEMREVALNSGAGMMIRDFDDNGQQERVALLWSTSDRIYMLSGKMSENLAVTVANSVQ